MTLHGTAFAIGLTGPFGSGCTTSASILRDRAGYNTTTLSSLIVDEWSRTKPGVDAKRSDLQALGNEIRHEEGPGALAKRAVASLESDGADFRHVVIDGIRNVGEVHYLKERFGHRFFLFALECQASERFQRLASVYGTDDAGLRVFRRDNENDRDQEELHGQQVALCVDLADALIINSDEVTLAELRGKLVDFEKVVTGKEPRYPNPLETLMNFAYSAAHGSKCLKRQVGAVVVDAAPGEMGEIVGQGFNENPRSTAPCVDEVRYGADPKARQRGSCYRDIVRAKSLRELAKDGTRCPSCGAPIAEPSPTPPWNCGECGNNLESYFWPERAMTLCTAIHAEAEALSSAGLRARGATLYTTTYPCFQCAERIAQAGVGAIVFTEPYPDIRATERIEIAGIETVRFEGIRSSKFDEIFSRARPYFEKSS